MKRSVIGAVKLLSPNHLGPGLTFQLPPCLHALPCSSAYNEKKVNNCIFLHFNIKKFIESRYKSLDKLVISLRSIQFSDPSTKNFQNSISIKPLWFYTTVTSLQSDHLLSFKPLWFNLSDLWFQPKFKFKSLRIFRAIFKSSIKPLIFSTGKLEYQHLSSLPDSHTELLVFPLKPGHHESKSTHQSGRWISTRIQSPTC